MLCTAESILRHSIQLRINGTLMGGPRFFLWAILPSTKVSELLLSRHSVYGQSTQEFAYRCSARATIGCSRSYKNMCARKTPLKTWSSLALWGVISFPATTETQTHSACP